MYQWMLFGVASALTVFCQDTQLTQAERKLLGTWEVEEVVEDGQVQKELAKARVTFRGRGESDWNEGEVIAPDGDKGRAAWRLTPKAGDNAIAFGFSMLIKPGIYKVDGDTLTMCFSGRGEDKPPKEFSGSKESDCTLWKLKRLHANGQRSSVVSDSMKKIQPALVTVQFSKAGDRPKDEKSTPNAVVGVVIDPKGIVIAPYENQQEDVQIEITFGNGAQKPAKIMLADAKVGVIVLLIEGDKAFSAAEFAESDKVEIGDTVLALGWAKGYSVPTVAAVIVSAKNRLNSSGEKVLQVDSPIGPGLNVGPLIDLNGQLLGMLPKAGSTGLAAPSNRLKELALKFTQQPMEK